MTAPRMSTRDIYEQLIRLAAEIVRGHPGLPNSDWMWYQTTPQAERRLVIRTTNVADEQCKVWAVEIRRLADALSRETL